MSWPQIAGGCRRRISVTSPSRIHLPATVHHAEPKSSPLQCVPPSCTRPEGQSPPQSNMASFWMPNISEHYLFPQLGHLRRHVSAAIPLQPPPSVLQPSPRETHSPQQSAHKASENETLSLPSSHFRPKTQEKKKNIISLVPSKASNALFQ